MESEWVEAPPRVMGNIEQKWADELRRKYLDHVGEWEGADAHRRLVEDIAMDAMQTWRRLSYERGVVNAMTRETLGGGNATPLKRIYATRSGAFRLHL